MSKQPTSQTSNHAPRALVWVWLVRVLIAAFVLLMVLLCALYYMASTVAGTRFLLEKADGVAGVELSYVSGDLVRGVQLRDVSVPIDADMSVAVSEATVQVGWRSLLGRQLHLVKPRADTVVIKNNKPSSDEPYDFATIATPLTLIVDDADIKKLRFEQAGSAPFELTDIRVQAAKWSGSKVETDGASLVIDQAVAVDADNVQIDLSGDYPLAGEAVVHIFALDEVYFSKLNAVVRGSLRHTQASVTGRYNGADFTATATAEPLAKDVPFFAQLHFDQVALPYATDEQIVLSDGIIEAGGTIEDIELRINSDLVGKYIPAGRYHGRGTLVDGGKSGLKIPFLQAHTAQGILTASGEMDWQNAFWLTSTLHSNRFDLQAAMPQDFADYKAYLPKYLNGDLTFNFYNEATSRYEIALDQRDGERIKADIRVPQGKAATTIQANWANLNRENLPDIGALQSPSGQADVRILGDQITIDAHAQIDKLNAAPKGEYRLNAQIDDGRRIRLSDFNYQGILGNLKGVANITLPSGKNPLMWQADLQTSKLVPNAYFNEPNKTPIDSLSGHIIATGRLRDEGGVAAHEIELARADLTALLSDGKRVQIDAKASANIHLKGDEITALTATAQGELGQDYLPKVGKTAFQASVAGDLKNLQIRYADAKGSFGKVSVAGKLSLDKGVAWDVRAQLDRVASYAFVDDENLHAVITGEAASKGSFNNGKLGKVSATFAGEVMHKNIPQGHLELDVVGEGNRFELQRVAHTGQAGDLSASGWVDISKGVAWQAQADLQAFNAQSFGIPSDISGRIALRGDWQKRTQMIAIDEMDLHGTLDGQPLKASGSLYAKLALPPDLGAYFARIKQAAARPRTTDELLARRSQIDANARQAQNIVQTLKADNLHISLGDNQLSMNGDDSELTGSVNISDLSQLYSKARGQIQGGVILINDHNALPTLYIDMAAKEVRAPNVVIQNAKIIGKVVNLGNSDSQLLVEGDNIIVLGKVIKSLRVDFSGTESQHTLSMKTNSAQISGQATIQGSLNRDTMTYRGVLSDGRASGSFGAIAQRQPTQFELGLNDNSIKVAAHCWQTAQSDAAGAGVICLQDTLSVSQQQGNVNLAIQNLDTQVFSAVLPDDIHWQSMLNGHAKVQWQKGQEPVVDAVIYSDNGRLGIYQEDTGLVEMPYKRTSIIAKSVAKGLQIRTDIAGVAGTGYADVIINPYQDNKPISGALVMNDLNLAVLRPFFPNLQTLNGQVNLAGGLGGTLSKPLFYGNAELTRGALTVIGVPMVLQDIQANLAIRGTQAILDGGFKSGEGVGKLGGEIDWQNEVQARLTVSGENLDINKPPLVMAQVSPDLEVIIKPFSKYVDVQGVVLIPSATLRPPEATADIVSESEDVSVLDRRITGNVDQILAVVEPWSINANIGVDLGKNIEFRGFGASLPLSGALHLTQSGKGVMQSRGVVQVSRRTKVDGIGQNLELNYAQVRFNGDMLNPRLAIEGQKQIEGQVIGVRVRGTVATPEITVFNDAGLSEQQAMNALLTGRISEANDAQVTEQGFRSQVTNQLAAAGLSLGLSGTRNLTNKLGNALGLESLTIDASGSSYDTNVNITGYITPDLYIRYGVGVFNAESSLSMRYQLTRRVYIEATSATENLVDVIYRWKF